MFIHTICILIQVAASDAKSVTVMNWIRVLSDQHHHHPNKSSNHIDNITAQAIAYNYLLIYYSLQFSSAGITFF